jgi:hypothetical protein
MLSEFAVEKKPCKDANGISEEAEVCDDEHHVKYLACITERADLSIAYCRDSDDRHVESIQQRVMLYDHKPNDSGTHSHYHRYQQDVYFPKRVSALRH